ncbi:hypothetical protein HDU92_008178 [Lobulomyces angularis]|nr:hypothetical protein HDU92_008178 [Lobulomyces angularis]
MGVDPDAQPVYSVSSSPMNTVLTSTVGVPPTSRKNSSNSSIHFMNTPMSVSSVNKSLATLNPKNELMANNNVETSQGTNWQAICIRVLPMFNGDGLKGCMEDLNELVLNWVKETAMQTVYNDLNELLDSGMLTLTNRLHKTDKSESASTNSLNESMIIAARISELWSFFFGKVLPSLQGAFLPIRISFKMKGLDYEAIDIKTMSLASFRDSVVLPVSTRLEEAFPKLPPITGTSSLDVSARLRQMLLILNNLTSGNPESLRQTAELLMVLNKSLQKGYPFERQLSFTS